jgi:hypothetical protein
MDDFQINQRVRKMLGSCDPWLIRTILKSGTPFKVDVWMSRQPGASFPCGMCGCMHPWHGDGHELIYECLQCDGLPMYVHFFLPYVKCPSCGFQHASVHWMHNPNLWRYVDADYSDDPPIYRQIH